MGFKEEGVCVWGGEVVRTIRIEGGCVQEADWVGNGKRQPKKSW